uniref:Putative ovule protein n=1 Tax=Solanum chacoense TaxID=4108 RepID=A0A0V0GRV6_SOLCH
MNSLDLGGRCQRHKTMRLEMLRQPCRHQKKSLGNVEKGQMMPFVPKISNLGLAISPMLTFLRGKGLIFIIQPLFS